MTPQQHRARAAWLRQFPNPKAQRAAELHELAALAIERKNANTSKPQKPQSIGQLLPSMSLQQKLQYAEQQRDKYSRVAASPDLSPPAALAARQLVRSYQAAVTLCEKAQAYESQKKAAALGERAQAYESQKKAAALGERAQAYQDRNSDTAVPAPTPTQAAMIFDRALTFFANVWVGLIAVLNLIAIIGFVVAAPTLWDGIAKVQEIYSPFNVWNWIVEVVALSPAVGAIAWRDRRLKRRPVAR